MIKTLWAKITKRGDAASRYSMQQGSYLGRVADFIVLFPYGMHANLPDNNLALLIDEKGRILIGTSTLERIEVEQGEVVFFHPKTRAEIHFRNNGDIDIETTGDANVSAANVNIDASVTNLGVGGAAIARVGDAVQVVVTGGSSAGTYAGTITSGGANTSI